MIMWISTEFFEYLEEIKQVLNLDEIYNNKKIELEVYNQKLKEKKEKEF
jgi:hypothetical protein